LFGEKSPGSLVDMFAGFQASPFEPTTALL